MSRPQVLLGEMPELLDNLLRDALADAEVDLLPRGAGIAALRAVGDDESPPVVVVTADLPEPERFEQELLRPHPEAVILSVERGGHVLATTKLTVIRSDPTRILTHPSLIEAIHTAPTWQARFA